MRGHSTAVAAGRGLEVVGGFEDLAIIVLYYFEIHGAAPALGVNGLIGRSTAVRPAKLQPNPLTVRIRCKPTTGYQLTKPSVGDVEIHALKSVTGLLCPDAILLHGHFVDLDVIHLELAALLVHPEIDVVILVLAAGLAEVGADEILALFFEVPHRLMDLDEVERQRLSRLVVLDAEMSVGVLMGRDIGVDRAHYLPSARYLRAAWMLLNGEPPPSDRHAGDHHIAVTLLLRAFLYPDIHQGELVTLGLEPEVNGVLLLGLILVVEDGIGEPTIALHAAHDLDLLVHEIEVLIEPRIMEYEDAVLAPLIHCLLHRRVHIVFGELFGRTA